MRKLTQETEKKIRLILGAMTAVWTVLVGVLFIIQVWRIFSLGEKSFTYSTIDKYFSQIALFVWLWIVLVFVNAVIHYILPAPYQKLKASVDEQALIRRLKNRLPVNSESLEAEKQKKIRNILKGICTVALCACFALALSVILSNSYKQKFTSGFFFSHPEAERLLFAMPWLVLSALFAIAYKYYATYSKKQELTALKNTLKNPQTATKKTETKLQKLTAKLRGYFYAIQTQKNALVVRIGLAILALTLIVWGICNGGMADVLEKAVNICTQCIGLG